VTAKQKARRRNEYEYNPFDDDDEIVVDWGGVHEVSRGTAPDGVQSAILCNLENPESCESCT